MYPSVTRHCDGAVIETIEGPHGGTLSPNPEGFTVPPAYVARAEQERAAKTAQPSRVLAGGIAAIGAWTDVQSIEDRARDLALTDAWQTASEAVRAKGWAVGPEVSGQDWPAGTCTLILPASLS